jgi:acetate kinase
MNILVINSGSSSLKFRLIKTGRNFELIQKGMIEKIGLKSAKIKTHKEALKLVVKNLKDEVHAIGHRVVHGGEKYCEPVKINSRVIKEIKKLSSLAPLHNPHNLAGILACKTLFPKTPQVAVFDTAYHQTLPSKAFLYGLPYSFYRKHNIRRYGFHGSSHKYVINETRKLLKKRNPKIISCHIGNGSSITASLNGKSIDTSMGFTPLEGVIMGTRSGTFDPAIIHHLEKTLRLSSDKIYEIINEESGLKGISEISSDMRKIYAKYLKKNPRAILTIELLSYQIAKILGSYIAALNGVDAITFTAGLGEKAFYVREKALKYLEFMGLKIDKKKNKNCETVISAKNSKVKVFVIPTNEEKQIAIETLTLIS